MFATEPLTVVALIERSLLFFRQTFPAVLPISLAVGAINAAATTLLAAVSTRLEGLEEGPELTQGARGVMIWVLPFVAAHALSIGAVSYSLVMQARGIPVSTQGAMLRGLSLMIPLSCVTIGYYCLVMLGLFALLVPGVIIAISAMLYPYVTAMEDRSTWGALYRSHQLIWPAHWLRACAFALISAGIVLAASTVLSLLSLPLRLFADDSAPWAAGTLVANFLGTWLALCVVVPLSSALLITLYADLRLRRDAAFKDENRERTPGSGSFDA